MLDIFQGGFTERWDSCALIDSCEPVISSVSGMRSNGMVAAHGPLSPWDR